MTSTNDIRRSFLDYFEKHGHARVPSAPLVPAGRGLRMYIVRLDPSLTSPFHFFLGDELFKARTRRNAA